MTGVFEWCGCFQVHLRIQSMVLWWRSMVLTYCIPLWRVWCMPSGPKMHKPNSIRRIEWYRLQSHGQSGGGRNRIANEKPLVRIPKENTHHIDLEWTEDEHSTLKTLLETYTSQGDSGACMVYRWRRACVSLVLGDTEDRYNLSGQWYDEWQLDTLVESPIIRLLRETFLPMLVEELAKYPKPDQDDESREALLQEQDRNGNALLGAPPPPKAMLCCRLPGQVRQLKWLWTKFFADNVDILHMYAEMGNDEHSEMQLKCQDSRNPSIFVTTPKVGGTGLNHTAANHAVITQMFWVLNKQRQAFARVVRLGQNQVPHTWLLNTGPGGYDNCTSDLHQLSGVAQMRVLAWLDESIKHHYYNDLPEFGVFWGPYEAADREWRHFAVW